MNAEGKFNGEDGWTIVVPFSDFVNPGNAMATKDYLSDAIRISAGINVYDTVDANDGFPRKQSWRTLIDGGNITVNY